ncbi:MAG: helix-turn-helix domain-containing protein [Acidobacteria bacterium]|nr:helix-turn-helix domain-containing protein [Acidobacteriota bacterium]
MEASKLLHEMRTTAGLTQRELARRAGTTASVICRMEDADYDGHTLAMLRRIATALGRRIEIHAVPVTKVS